MHLTDLVVDRSAAAAASRPELFTAEFRAALRFAFRCLTLLYLQSLFGAASDDAPSDFGEAASLWLAVYAGFFFTLALAGTAAVLFVVMWVSRKLFAVGAAQSPEESPVAEQDDDATSAVKNGVDADLLFPCTPLLGWELLPSHVAEVLVGFVADAAVCAWSTSTALLLVWPAAELGFAIVAAVALRIRMLRSNRLVRQAMQSPVVILSCGLVGLCFCFGLAVSLVDGDSWDALYGFVHTVVFLGALRVVLVQCVTAASFSDVFVASLGGFVTSAEYRSEVAAGATPAGRLFLSFGATPAETARTLLWGSARSLLVTFVCVFLSKMLRLSGAMSDSVETVVVFTVSQLASVPFSFWLIIFALAVTGAIFDVSRRRGGNLDRERHHHRGSVASLIAGSAPYAWTLMCAGLQPLTLPCALWNPGLRSTTMAATSSSSSEGSDGSRGAAQQQQQQPGGRDLSDLLFFNKRGVASRATGTALGVQHLANASNSMNLLKAFAIHAVAHSLLFFVTGTATALMWLLWIVLGVPLVSALLSIASAFLHHYGTEAGFVSAASPDPFPPEAVRRFLAAYSEERTRRRIGLSSSNANSKSQQQQQQQQMSLAAFTALLKSIWAEPHERRLFLFFLLTSSFMCVEFAVGASSDSLGLISDAFHMLVDASSIFVGLAAAHASRWKPTASHPFGFSRYEATSAMFNGAMLLVVACHIVVEALHRVEKTRVVQSSRVLPVSIAGLLLNVVGVVFFHDTAAPAPAPAPQGGSPLTATPVAAPDADFDLDRSGDLQLPPSYEEPQEHEPGCPAASSSADAATATTTAVADKESHDANMRGIFLHILADLLGSVAVVVSSIVIQYTGWNIVDPICALAVSVLICFAAYSLLSSTFAAMTSPPSFNDETLVDSPLLACGCRHRRSF